jgi:phosphoribosylaminoimidazole-succinocarboxamide synthase
MSALLESHLTGLPVRRGKVRDVYDLGDKLLLVATDRISAFDWVMPTGIPDKGRILTQLSTFWFELLGVPDHVLATDTGPGPAAGRRSARAGRPQHHRPQVPGRARRMRRPRLPRRLRGRNIAAAKPCADPVARRLAVFAAS